MKELLLTNYKQFTQNDKFWFGTMMPNFVLVYTQKLLFCIVKPYLNSLKEEWGYDLSRATCEQHKLAEIASLGQL